MSTHSHCKCPHGVGMLLLGIYLLYLLGSNVSLETMNLTELRTSRGCGRRYDANDVFVTFRQRRQGPAKNDKWTIG